MTASPAHFNQALTPRESVVLDRIVAGDHFKQIGRTLGISHRTVESHRASIKLKLGARNTADIVRIAMMRKASVQAISEPVEDASRSPGNCVVLREKEHND